MHIWESVDDIVRDPGAALDEIDRLRRSLRSILSSPDKAQEIAKETLKAHLVKE